MTNSELLMEKINENGLKVSFVASKLGITRAGLYNKVRNRTQFNQTELKMLCGLLHIDTFEEMDAIFFNNDVGK